MISELNELGVKLLEFDWSFADSKPDPIHSLHPYPAKFIPEIPRALMNALPIPKDTIIVDPFCGSGVTLLEAQKIGIQSVGVDINPIACLLSKVKTQPLPCDFLETAREIAYESQRNAGRALVPAIPNLGHWFKPEIQVGLASLLSEIKKVRTTSLFDALRFCVSSIVVRVSNQESDTRYAAVENKWVQKDVFDLFLKLAEKLATVKNDASQEIPSRVLQKSALELKKTDFPQKIGLVVTSPPYPNAFEYWLYHKYRMWWLDYDPLEVKKNEIGARAHYFKKNHQTIDDFYSQMKSLLLNLYQLSAKDAFICIVIGRSRIHGEIFSNEDMISKIGKHVGFYHVATIERRINPNRKSFNLSHARINEEFILILKK